jgi:hypothetical protein
MKVDICGAACRDRRSRCFSLATSVLAQRLSATPDGEKAAPTGFRKAEQALNRPIARIDRDPQRGFEAAALAFDIGESKLISMI